MLGMKCLSSEAGDEKNKKKTRRKDTTGFIMSIFRYRLAEKYHLSDGGKHLRTVYRPCNYSIEYTPLLTC